MNIGRLLHRLEAERVRVAQEAMEQPSGGDVFAHGRVVGTYVGLVRAREIIEEMLRDEERHGARL